MKIPVWARWLVVLIGGACSWFGIHAQGHLSTGRGAVHSIDGKALERVWVQQLGVEYGRATEADGRFDFPPGEVPVTLLFFKDGSVR